MHMIIFAGEQGTGKIRPLVIQYQDMMQAFEQADNELSHLKDNLSAPKAPPVRKSYNLSMAVFVEFMYFIFP